MAGFSFGFGANNAAPAASTSTAPSFSLTGAAQPAAGQPAAAPSFSFGNAAAPTQPGASTSTAAGTGGSLFGGFGGQQPQQQQQQPAQAGTAAGGLFGGSLFGAKTATTTAPATGGAGLFGSTTQPQQQQQQPQQPGATSLFGQTQAAGASTAAGGTTSLFGQQSTTQQPATTTGGGGGLFGSFNQPQQPQQQQPAASTSLFGQSTTTQPALLGSGGLAGPTNQPGQGGLTKSTKFSDLPEAHQKTIEQLDQWIKEQKAASSGIHVDALGRAIWQTTGSIKAASEEHAALTHGLVALESGLTQLRARFAAEEEDLRRVAEIWETYKDGRGPPGSSGTTGTSGSGGVRFAAAHRDFPHDFFSRLTAGMAERTKRYKHTIEQLDRTVTSLASDQAATGSASGSAAGAAASQAVVAQTIQNHQNAILNLAAHLETLQIRMNALRGSYADEYRSRTGSMRDPFDVAREDRGIAAPVRI